MNNINISLIVFSLFIFSCASENTKNKSQYSTIKVNTKYLFDFEDSIILEKESRPISILYTGLGKGYHIDEHNKYYKFDSIPFGKYQAKYSNIFNELITDSIEIKNSTHHLNIDRTNLQQLDDNFEFSSLIIDTLHIKTSMISNGSNGNQYSFWVKGNNICYRINDDKIDNVLSTNQKEFLNQFYQELKQLNKKNLLSSKYDKYLIISNNDTTIFKDSDQLWHGREKLDEMMKDKKQ
ncbi:MAG: hypothetical protein N4A35_05525 [Flavobacteriales bacterium]|jgi:hypothetical protein|nr:hypothetical protein [Flavobacteriales bacterium]